jgi:hypothetical protein
VNVLICLTAPVEASVYDWSEATLYRDRPCVSRLLHAYLTSAGLTSWALSMGRRSPVAGGQQTRGVACGLPSRAPACPAHQSCHMEPSGRSKPWSQKHACIINHVCKKALIYSWTPLELNNFLQSYHNATAPSGLRRYAPSDGCGGSGKCLVRTMRTAQKRPRGYD